MTSANLVFPFNPPPSTTKGLPVFLNFRLVILTSNLLISGELYPLYADRLLMKTCRVTELISLTKGISPLRVSTIAVLLPSVYVEG